MCMMRMYTEILPFMLIPSGFSGFATGMYINIANHTTPIEMFTNWIGYTSIGLLTGITYPVSFPLLAGYVIYKK
jgi:hypothetical protein